MATHNLRLWEKQDARRITFVWRETEDRQASAVPVHLGDRELLRILTETWTEPRRVGSHGWMEVYGCIEQRFEGLLWREREGEPLNSGLWSVATVPNHKHCKLQRSLSRLPVGNFKVLLASTFLVHGLAVLFRFCSFWFCFVFVPSCNAYLLRA